MGQKKIFHVVKATNPMIDNIPICEKSHHTTNPMTDNMSTCESLHSKYDFHGSKKHISRCKNHEFNDIQYAHL